MLDGITDLHAWRPYPAAVMSRAVIEQCGYLLYESGKIADAWAGAKTSDVPDDLVMCGRYWVRTSDLFGVKHARCSAEVPGGA
jgi:hypothetical protein